MTIGSLPMACTEIGTEFATATPFTLANATLLTAGGLSVPYNVSSWVGKTYIDFTMTPADIGAPLVLRGYQVAAFGSCSPVSYAGYSIIQLFENYSAGVWVNLDFELNGASLGQGFFTTLNINSRAYASSSATYTTNGTSYSRWVWATPNSALSSGVAYPVNIV